MITSRRRILSGVVFFGIGLPVVGWAVRYILSGRRLRWDDEFAREIMPVSRALLPSGLTSEHISHFAFSFVEFQRSQRLGAEARHGGRGSSTPNSAFGPGTKVNYIDGKSYRKQLARLAIKIAPDNISDIEPSKLKVHLLQELEEFIKENPNAKSLEFSPNGKNLYVDLLRFFYRGRLSIDILYAKSIGAKTCRGLDGVERAPILSPS